MSDLEVIGSVEVPSRDSATGEISQARDEMQSVRHLRRLHTDESQCC
jgi:hypothetical protein